MRNLRKRRKSSKTISIRRNKWKEILMIKENHILRDTEMLGNNIITQKTLLSGTITHKCTLNRLSPKFVTFQRWKVYKTYTTKRVKIIISRLYVIKSKERRIKAKNLGGKAIDQVDSSGQCLNPKMRRNRSLKK